MTTLHQKTRLIELRSMFAFERAKAKQDGFKMDSDGEELAVLSMMCLAKTVAGALNEDMAYRDSPVDRAEAISCVIRTALQGVPDLLKQDPEIAYQLGIVLQAEIEQVLKGDPHDRTEDRSGR